MNEVMNICLFKLICNYFYVSGANVLTTIYFEWVFVNTQITMLNMYLAGRVFDLYPPFNLYLVIGKETNFR